MLKLTKEQTFILEKLYKSKIAYFKDSSFNTLADAIEYRTTFLNQDLVTAVSEVSNNNFCDLKIMLSLEELGLVELIDSSAIFTPKSFKISDLGLKFLRESKINQILD